ncbi:acetylglutamate kinase [Sporocytophaga myxococcoides]|uniref:Acetylglutamate kinase n=1 Tax=Sporocytophaga myxococcoides TaxID=153721 RepID=A0A098LCQ3_9BACT|nr:acetylglutamate kinase [Sporocytophaga myxococcoides]GAL83943.1 acetylglutamate kinase [Sporocytophaga myxococcoides]
MEKLYIIKVGGNVIDDDKTLQKFLKDLSSLKTNKILVHGGGKVATEISKGLGIEAQMVDGRRITDTETLKIVTMVYGGLINKKVVSQLQSMNTNAIGLTGADANIMLASKRPVKNGIDYGFVGDVEKIEAAPLATLISSGLTPVIAPLTHDGKGNMLNTNADTVASTLAVALSKSFDVSLVYCFELKGVLQDINDKNSVISSIDTEKYGQLKQDGVIAKGMIPKMDNSFDAIKAGVKSVIICHADDIVSIVNQSEQAGTVLKA